MNDLASVHVIVYGHVQGVFFRAFVAEKAAELGVNGYVRNLYDGRSVEVKAEGEKAKLEKLISYLKEGPPSARIDRVVANWSEHTGIYSRFNIRY